MKFSISAEVASDSHNSDVRRPTAVQFSIIDRELVILLDAYGEDSRELRFTGEFTEALGKLLSLL